jgi:hypothetical protein
MIEYNKPAQLPDTAITLPLRPDRAVDASLSEPRVSRSMKFASNRKRRISSVTSTTRADRGRASASVCGA